MKSSNLFLMICCILLVSSCKKEPKKLTALQIKLDSLYTKEFPNPEEPGGSVLIKKGDKTLFLKNYGVADIETQEKITENTLFNTASISKTFVANAILILQQQGKLSIDDAIAKYFNDFKHPEIANKITIKHWLSHTSGIPDARKVVENREFYLTAKDTQNFEPLKHVDSLYFEPGQYFTYSNPSYNGLALIIDQITGAPWQEFIYNNIYEPSGMIHSTIADGAHPTQGVSHGYIYKDGKYHQQDYGEEPTFAASGNSGIWSSVLELAKYEEAIQNHVFLNEKLTKESRTPWKPANWKSKYTPFVGYSWFIAKERFFAEPNPYGVSFVYHTGSNAGFNSFHIRIPEKDLLIIGLFNQPLKEYKQFVFKTMDIIHDENWGE